MRALAAALLVLAAGAAARAGEEGTPAPAPSPAAPAAKGEGTADPTADAVARARRAIEDRDLIGAESILRERLEAAPGDDGARYLRARVLGWVGRREESLQEWDVLLGKEPKNGDYLVGKAYVLWFEGRAEEVRPLVERALAANPRHEDAQRLRIRVLGALGDRKALDAARAQVRALFPDREADILGATRLGTPEEAPRLGEVEAGLRYEALSGGRDPWKEESLEGLFRYTWPRDPGPLTDRALVGTRLLRAERFGKSDTSARGFLSAPVDAATSLSLAAEASPSHEILARWGGEAEAARSVGGGWVLHGGARRLSYDDAEVAAFFGEVEKYAGPWRFAGRGTETRLLGGGSGIGEVLSADRFYGIEGLSRFGLAVGLGDEVERTGAGVVRTRVRSITLRGRHWFDPRWAVTWDVGVTDVRGAYRRTGAYLGLRWAF